jgi:abortive infection bacteriophage resistance protein
MRTRGAIFLPEDNNGKRVFNKLPKNGEALLDVLRGRGMQIPDPDRALKYLEYIGYYRLSGYFPPFRQNPSDDKSAFMEGVDFGSLLDHYVFDRKLRLLLIDALERIEVAVRAVISDKMALAYGTFWWKNPDVFENAKAHEKILETITQVTSKNCDEKVWPGKKRKGGRSKPTHLFVSKFFEKYQGEDLPCWMLFEVLSFGSVSIIYKQLRKSNQKAISTEFGLNHAYCESWLHCLSFARNIAAHHGRIWNRAFTIQPKISNVVDGAMLTHERSTRLYGVCVVISYFLEIIAKKSHWPDRLRFLLREYPEMPLDKMGFPPDWTSMDFWKNRFYVEDGEGVLCPVTHALCHTPKS